MPERTFGRMVRSHRTKLGISQAKLGELVGRSPTTIRSWEKGQSQPNDPEVITALSAVLGIPEHTVYDRTGQQMPVIEESPTVEQALATLNPGPVELEAAAPIAVDEQQPAEPDAPAVSEPVATGESLTQQPAYLAPPDPYYVTTAVPPAHEPSYMEDRVQRQLYRVRTLATVVILVSLGIAFLWAFSQGWEALGEWWSEFFGSLRL